MTRAESRIENLTAMADAAFRLAMQDVVQRAKQTGTPVIIWKDGRVQHIPPDQIEMPETPPAEPLAS